jgi:hypothetical protein
MGSAGGRVAHPYGGLIELAERERRLIATRDYEGLTEIVASRAALMADLPQTAPEDAHEAIAHLIELHEENDAALKQASLGVEVELSRLRSGRAGVRRYAPAARAGQRVSESA